MKVFTTFLLTLCIFSLCFADTPQDNSIEVVVEQSGETINITTNSYVLATPQETWAVLTDYAHMAEFLPNLQSSQIISAPGESLRVEQKGTTRFGLLHFSFESVRQVDIKPYDTIESHAVSGNMRKLDGTTQLTQEGAGTHIQYKAVAIPDFWMPPLIGKTFIKSQLEEQFQGMIKEILRRKMAANGGVSEH